MMTDQKAPPNTEPVESIPQVAPLHAIAASDLAPVILVDGLEGFIYNDTIVKINITQDVMAQSNLNPAGIERRIAAHLVFTHKTLDQIYEWLGRNIANRDQFFSGLSKNKTEKP